MGNCLSPSSASGGSNSSRKNKPGSKKKKNVVGSDSNKRPNNRKVSLKSDTITSTSLREEIRSGKTKNTNVAPLSTAAANAEGVAAEVVVNPVNPSSHSDAIGDKMSIPSVPLNDTFDESKGFAAAEDEGGEDSTARRASLLDVATSPEVSPQPVTSPQLNEGIHHLGAAPASPKIKPRASPVSPQSPARNPFAGRSRTNNNTNSNNNNNNHRGEAGGGGGHLTRNSDMPTTESELLGDLLLENSAASDAPRRSISSTHNDSLRSGSLGIQPSESVSRYLSRESSILTQTADAVFQQKRLAPVTGGRGGVGSTTPRLASFCSEDTYRQNSLASQSSTVRLLAASGLEPRTSLGSFRSDAPRFQRSRSSSNTVTVLDPQQQQQQQQQQQLQQQQEELPPGALEDIHQQTLTAGEDREMPGRPDEVQRVSGGEATEEGMTRFTSELDLSDLRRETLMSLGGGAEHRNSSGSAWANSIRSPNPTGQDMTPKFSHMRLPQFSEPSPQARRK